MPNKDSDRDNIDSKRNSENKHRGIFGERSRPNHTDDDADFGSPSEGSSSKSARDAKKGDVSNPSGRSGSSKSDSGSENK